MKRGILVTAIGSLSSKAVIASLIRMKNYSIYGCDIFPAAWHAEALRYKKAFTVPKAADEDEYIAEILTLCAANDIDYIIPLTDVEVDAFKLHRKSFEERGITLCMQDDYTLLVARDKHRLTSHLPVNSSFRTVPTYWRTDEIPHEHSFPFVAKPKNGRSSEGLLYIEDEALLAYVSSKENYIIQPFINGDIITVDYIRSRASGSEYSFVRRELLRTSNGAGITVQLIHDKTLQEAASLIGRELDVNGCINMEFIQADNNNYLIDINPRFSAGIAFTAMTGYDIVKNHLNCFIGKDLDKPVVFNDVIIARSYAETVTQVISERTSEYDS